MKKALLTKISGNKFRGIPAAIIMDPISGKATLVEGFKEAGEFLAILDENKKL